MIFRALRAAGDNPAIRLDLNSRWYVDSRLEVVGNGVIGGVGAKRSSEPGDAVHLFWREIENLPDGHALTLNGSDPTRRLLRWNGFMWEDVRERPA